jgi:putative salt-induced outer membrane protein YdiY
MFVPFACRLPVLPCLALALAAGGLVCPRAAAAQSADDIASRVGTVARAMGAVSKDPWTLDAALTGNLTRGNTDSLNVRTTVVYVLDSGAWRFGSYLSGAVENTNGVRNKERAGLNLALARRYSEDFRLVLIEEIVRAPLDGLRARNLLGSMVVWTPDGGGRIESSIYAGAGWASEHFTGDQATANYGALLAGATSSLDLSATSTLNLVGSYTQDLVQGGNYKLGSSVALDAAVNSVLGLQIAYALSYDHAPAQGRVRTNNAISAGLTLGWKGAPPAGGAP